MVLRNLRLWNGSISYHYWQKPGVVRLTKVYIFNVTNPEGFLNGEKPKLNEVGPFVYREEMEKVNIKFHENNTVSYQHNKILKFVPELSAEKSLQITVPNIPLLTLSTHSNSLNRFFKIMISMAVRNMGLKPFVHVTAEDLAFGYDDQLTALAHTFYPKHKRPMKKMGLLLGRNGTGVTEVHTIHTGHSSMADFGYLDRLNGLDTLPFWPRPPCNAIRASEGSFFPPRDRTHEDVVYIYDKDLCRAFPLTFKHMTEKKGVKAGFYSPPDDIFAEPEQSEKNRCFCAFGDKCSQYGLQNISPCQFDAPVYLSFPHFLKADPSLLEAVEGLRPVEELHQTYFMIQPKLGVPLEGKIRVQLNLRVENAPYISIVSQFPDFVFPVMWLEEGIDEVTPSIQRWIYLGTTVVDIAGPLVSYGLIVIGSIMLIVLFIRAYRHVVFTAEALERGKATIRRGSSFLINGQHRLMIVRDSYTLLDNINGDPSGEPEGEIDEEPEDNRIFNEEGL